MRGALVVRIKRENAASLNASDVCEERLSHLADIKACIFPQFSQTMVIFGRDFVALSSALELNLHSI